MAATRLSGVRHRCGWRLARAHGPELGARYDREPFVLPMVKVADRGTRAPYDAGIARVRDILARRVAPHSLEQVFTEPALDFLITYSGGNLRHLLQMVQEACTRTNALPMPLAAAHRAIQGMVKTYSAAIDESHWARLARLGPWETPEMRACLEQYVSRKLPVIPVLLPGAPDKPTLPLFLRAFTWVDLRDGLSAEGLDRLEWGITGQKPVRPR